MSKERLLDYTDEIYKDDGRKSDGKDHKGDWGSHTKADRKAKNGDERKVVKKV